MKNLLIVLKLLPDTEILKDIAEDLVGGDLAGDFTQVVQYLSNILGQQVGGQGRGQALGSPGKRL